uniref:Uncharacterized protein n=1 Tax=Candidatus Kentrum sp. DK TaxID=2126562 RepID=A0A450SZL9_9GAMM|nr:MAG: hypothetical protein BECKDK2373B_GA0170837_105311 [Candidatus Kentron sp. DK]VFJ59704.1 MAG: hypothetical protein BECKDK2373C_GA0170839_107310 [Candidatus Kentron sp. DK]
MVICTSFAYEMLRKRYQNLLIKHIKAWFQQQPSSDTPDPKTTNRISEDQPTGVQNSQEDNDYCVLP